MPCYRQGQNHISVFLHFVSKLTFPIAIHCKTNAGSTHILVALRRGWEKDCCCYVHLALLPTGWNKSIAKSKSDGQKRHDHVTQATMHSNSPCQKPLTNLDLQSTLEFPCPKPCPKIMLQSASVHPSADVVGSRVVLPVDVLPAVLQCDPKSVSEWVKPVNQWRIGPGNPLKAQAFVQPLERFGWLENSCYEYTTLARIYCRLLLIHLRELRRPLLDSDCTNACAFNGRPKIMKANVLYNKRMFAMGL